ncbi:MAG: cyclic nucleotide-binding domain-containing protein, partial [bacterium]|nr:cyclic nucleotide-binding domain-containing protein [bacterium]
MKKAMARDPDARYPSVSQFQRDVELFLHGSWYQRTETFAPGSTIVSEGEDGDAAYIIVEGRCAAVRERGSKKVVLRELGPGDVFGETAVFSAARRTATVEALDEVTVTVVTRETLAAGVGLNSWLGNFIKALAERFSEVDRRL